MKCGSDNLGLGWEVYVKLNNSSPVPLTWCSVHVFVHLSSTGGGQVLLCSCRHGCSVRTDLMWPSVGLT